LGRTLVDVFGQHENQRLFDESQHVAYVDSFLADPAVRGRVAECFRRGQATLAELQQIVEAFHDGQRNRDYLAFRLEALRTFEPSADEYEKVASLCRRAEGLVRVKG